MKNFYSALKNIFRLRWINLVKLLSLTLGIVISSALMCRVAYEQSFDSAWSEVETLNYLEQNLVNLNDKTEDGDDFGWATFSALAPEMADKLSSVKSATRFQGRSTYYVSLDDKPLQVTTYRVDSSFFETLALKIIEGEEAKIIINSPDGVILSQLGAQTLFPGGNAIGSQFKVNDSTYYTVRAICENIPNNSIIDYAQMFVGWKIPIVWDGWDSFKTLFRSQQGVTIEQLNTEISELFKPRYADWVKEDGIEMKFRASNIREIFKRRVAEIDLIMSLLALALILIAGLNFALLSISSLASRAKEVGVRKAAGARGSSIFALILWETIIYVTLAALFAAALLWGAKPQFETMIGGYDEVFAFENFWAVGVVLGVMIVVSGVLPAWIFARIPVTQVFQSFTSNRLRWKRALLFFQFTASIFVLCFMMLILRQYDALITHDVGYQHEKLVSVQISSLNENGRQALASQIMLQSGVEGVSRGESRLYFGLSGEMISTQINSQERKNIRVMWTDSAFFATFNIPILQGSPLLTGSPDKGGNVVITRSLVQHLGIKDNPIGQQFYRNATPYTIAGVCQDFQTASLRSEKQPVMIVLRDTVYRDILTIRLTQVTPDAIKNIEKTVATFYPNLVPPAVSIDSDAIRWTYNETKMFRDGVIVASIVLLIITIMGVMGYVGIETRRRAKEIAIRRIHGSSAMNIIWSVARGLLITALVASVIAIPIAYIIGEFWQAEFAVKVAASWDIFAVGAGVIFATIFVCTTIQTWFIATKNPSNSLER